MNNMDTNIRKQITNILLSFSTNQQRMQKKPDNFTRKNSSLFLPLNVQIRIQYLFSSKLNHNFLNIIHTNGITLMY